MALRVKLSLCYIRMAHMLSVNEEQGVDVFSQDDFGWTAEGHAYIKGFNLYVFTLKC